MSRTSSQVNASGYAELPSFIPEHFAYSNWIVWLLAFLAARLCYVAVKKYQDYQADLELARRNGCQMPRELPKRWPLGIDRIVELWQSNADGHLLAFLCSVAKDYEPQNMLYQNLLFGPRAFHVLHPTNVETVLSTRFNDYGFGVRAAVFRPLLKNGIFTLEGAAWKHSRELLRKQFARAQYQKLEEAFGEHVDNLMTRLPATSGVVDLQPLFYNLTLDVSTALLFGRSVYGLRADIDQVTENKVFAESFDIALSGVAKRFRLPPFHWLYNPPAFRKACRNVHEYVEKYIRERQPESWFIEQLSAEATSETDLRDQLLNVLLASRDTTAACLSWTFRLLVRHPRVMQRLRSEVVSVMKDGDKPTREQIRAMPFLAHVINESLRVYPPVPLNNREALVTTLLPTGGGPEGNHPILVRKGEMVVFSQYVNSRVKNIFGEDAAEFRPERWETGEMENIGWAHFPFIGGPRLCLGQDFALMEVSYTIVRLLRAYEVIVIPPGEKVEPTGSERQALSLVLTPAEGCRVAMEKANKTG